MILIHMSLFDGWPLQRHGDGAAGLALEAAPEKEGQARTGELE